MAGPARTLTGLDLGAFCELIAPFAAACQQQADARFPPHRPRQRQAGAGRKGHLPSPEAPGSLPYRKPRRSKAQPKTGLTPQQQAQNRHHARHRIKVEHAIAGSKRLGAVSQVCRNKATSFTDRLLALACGIWNWFILNKPHRI